MQFKHVPIVLSGIDTKTDEKNAVIGALKYAKNMVMQKTKKWASRFGCSTYSTATVPNAVLLAEDNYATKAIDNAGAVYSISSTAASVVQTVGMPASDFMQLPITYGMNYINSEQNFVVFTSTISQMHYLNNKLYQTTSYSTGDTYGNGVSHSTDNANFVFCCSANGTVAYAWGVTTPTATKTKAVVAGGNAKTAGLSGVCCIIRYTAANTIKGWCWDVNADTTTAEFTINGISGTFGIDACMRGCNDGNFRVAFISAANTFTIYKITPLGVATLESTQTFPAVFTGGNVINCTMARDGVVFYSVQNGTTKGCSLRNVILGYYIASQSGAFGFGSGDDIVLTSAHDLSARNITYLKSATNKFLSYGYPQQFKNGIFVSATTISCGLVSNGVGKATFSNTILPTLAQNNGDNYVAAGSIYNISTGVQAGFAGSPAEINTMTVNPATGSLVAGVYALFFAWHSTDSSGKSYYSPIGTITSKTCAAVASSIDISFQEGIVGTLSLFASKDNGLYYEQLSGISYSASAVNSVSFTTFSEAIPYPFQGGLVDSGALPSVKSVATCLGRIWATLASANNDTWCYSTKAQINTGARFPSEFRLVTANTHGSTVIAYEMDNKAVLFHEYGIYVTWGDGPDETGAGAFTEPQLISQGVGCKFARSVVLTDNGLMFMSHEGIYLVNRGMTLEYIGAQVEDYNSLTITSAINLADRHQIWFYSQEGTTLVYDEYHKIWSTFTNQDTKAVAVIKGVPTYIKITDSKILEENKTVYIDNAIPYSCELQTQWMNLAEVQGYQRLRKLTWNGASSNDATLKLYRDWGNTEFETFTIPSSITPYQFQVKPKIQKGEAMRFDLTYSNITALVEIDAFGVEAGFAEGTFRLNPTSQRVKGA